MKLKKRVKNLEEQVELLTNIILAANGYQWNPIQDAPDYEVFVKQVNADVKWFGAKKDDNKEH